MPRCIVKTIPKFCLAGSVAVIGILVGLRAWPYQLIASPRAVLRVVDQDDKPLAGLRVVRRWDTSEGQRGEDELWTDSNGQVTFAKVATQISQLKRITKPLLIFVPAACGPGWEIYGQADFDIFLPEGYVPEGSDMLESTFQADEGKARFSQARTSTRNYVELHTFKNEGDVAYTLKFQKVHP